jgi:hypothetical protein
MAASDRTFELRLLGVLLAGVAVFAFWVVPASVKDPAGFGYSDGLAPSFSIYLVATLAAVTLAGRLVRILMADAPTGQPKADAALQEPHADDLSQAHSAGDEDATDSKNRAYVIISACLLFAFLFVPFLGFYISSFGFVLFLALTMGERRPVVLLLLPGLLLCGVYAGFELGFTIFLPRGELVLQFLDLIGD